MVFKFGVQYQVHYEIEVSWIRELNEASFLFELDKKQVYINNKAPDKIVDKLAEEMGKILYPLQIVTNKYGFLTGIANIGVVRERWLVQKKSIVQRYEGKISDDAIAAMDSSLSDLGGLIETIKKDWFIALLFSGIYGLKQGDSKEPIGFKLPFLYLIRHWLTMMVSVKSQRLIIPANVFV
ncbi:hypothetical protein [Pedobacter sp. NJ-S-72]